MPPRGWASNSSFDRLIERSANTRRACSRVPGSFRTPNAMVVRKGRAVGRRPRHASAASVAEDEELRPVVGHVLDGFGEDREPETRRGTAREDGRGGSIALVDDEFAGSGGVVRRQSRFQRRERRNRSDWPSAWMCEYTRWTSSMVVPGSAARHRSTGTTTSPTIDELVLEEEVVDLPDRAVDKVLDRHDASSRRRRGSRPRRPRGSRRPATRGTSPNAAMTASSANAPGSPAYATGSRSASAAETYWSNQGNGVLGVRDPARRVGHAIRSPRRLPLPADSAAPAQCASASMALSASR